MMINKRRIIYFLVSLSVLLLIINIAVEVNSQKNNIKITPPTIRTIENSFSLVLDDYSINSDWVKKTYVKKKLSDSLNYLFKVTIPIDISIPDIIKDLNKYLKDDSIELITYEKKNYGDTIIKIFSDGMLKFQASLKQSKNIYRKHAEYSFYVIAPDSKEYFENNISRIYYPHTLLLSPSSENYKLIQSQKVNYAILLNDLIANTKYSLEENYSKQKLLNQIRSIIIDFGKDHKYLIDKKSALYNSKIYSFLRDEFNKRGITFESLQKYDKLKGNTTSELISLFDFHTTSLKGKEGKTFIINFKDFITLQKEITKRIKKGDIIR